MNGVYMKVLQMKPPLNIMSQTIGNMGNISEVTPKTIRISWEVTPHWHSLQECHVLLTQQASATNSESVILQVENLVRADDA